MVGLSLLVSVCSCWSIAATANPLRLSGFLGYEYRFDEDDDGKRRMEHSQLLGMTASTPLWQPWFAQLTTGVQLRFSRVRQEDNDYDTRHITGEARLNLFPVSHFPVELYYERGHDRLDSSDVPDTKILLTRFGLRQRFTSSAGTHYSGRIEHAERHSERSDGSSEHKQIADSASLGVAHFFKDHSLLFDVDTLANDDVTRAQVTRRSFAAARHRYSPNQNFTLNGQVTYRDSRVERDTSNFGLYRSEWSEFALWSPENFRSLSIRAGVRLVHSGSLFTTSSGGQDTASAQAGARYELTDHWSIGADVDVRQDRNDEGRKSSSHQRILARYDADSHRIGEFDYGWFTAFVAGNENDAGEHSVQYGEARIGHELVHYQVGNTVSPWRIRFSQEAATHEDTEQESEQTLLHHLGISRSWLEPTTSTFAGISFSDNRTFDHYDRDGDKVRNFQFISARLSREKQFSRDVTLTGQISLQVSRYEGYFDDRDREYQPSTSIDITYGHRRLFDVPRLRFTSTLRLFSDSYLPLVDELDDDDDFEGSSWENRLQYVIGQLDFLLLTRLSEIRERDRAFVFFQVRRHFDRIVN